MSKLEMIDMEITRRQEATNAMKLAMPELLAAIEQFNKLDEMYRSDEKDARVSLEGLYKENRHFTGKQPLIYSFAQTELYPFFQGSLDSQCNPYFPITKVQDKTFDGLSPFPAPPNKTGAYGRDVSYSPTEDVARIPAGVALQAFPNISGEPLPAGWPGAPVMSSGFCTGGVPPGAMTEPACLTNGGVWTPSSPLADPVWVGSATAPALLRIPLQAWKSDIQIIISDIYNDAAELAYWQNIVTNIDIVLASITNDAVFVRATGNPDPAAWGQTQSFTGTTETARQILIAAATTGIPSHKSSRQSFLNKEAATEEEVFFGIIKLRLHQANGSFAKLRAAKSQVITNQSLIDDNIAAINSLNLLKVKAS